MGVIYKATNLINGKVYIGQTINFMHRVYQHRSDSNNIEKRKGNSYFHNAMNQYGVDNFKFEIIEEIDNSLLNEREQYWIKFYNSYTPNGYNLTLGGDGFKGHSRPQSEEEKNKRKEIMIEKYQNNPILVEECKKRTTDLWKDENYRNNVIEGLKNFHKNNPNFFKGENNPFFGHKHTEETKNKLKKSKKSYFVKQLNKDNLEIIKIYESLREMSRQTGYDHGWVSKAAKQNKVAYGYKWEILESVTTNCNSEISTE